MNDPWAPFWSAVAPFSVLITVVVTIVIAIGVRFLLVAISRSVVRGIVSGARKQAGSSRGAAAKAPGRTSPRIIQRTKTMGAVLDNFVTWVIAALTVLVVMQELGIPLAAVLASAGIVGAAVAFGAQSIIKDVLSGFLMVVEDQLGVGDEVDLGLASGTVETVGVRVTTLRDKAGVIWFVRNGEILRVGNKSYQKRKQPTTSASGQPDALSAREKRSRRRGTVS
jgi:small conductance mechanosensitive channel